MLQITNRFPWQDCKENIMVPVLQLSYRHHSCIHARALCALQTTCIGIFS